jgi:hypothetical protein
MLIPNKFSGYQSDGCRLLHVGGGVGEAMLIGAAMGGGSAAVTGGDPLKGALIGGLTGGAGAGISSGIAALNPATTTALTAGEAVAGTAAGAGGATTATLPAATTGTTAGTVTAATPGVGTSLTVAGAPSGLAASSVPGFVGPVNYGIAPPTGAAPTGLGINLSPGAGTQLATTAPSTTGGTFLEGVQRAMQDPIASIKRNPFPAGASALAGAVGTRKEEEEPAAYSGPLSRFKYNPDVYRPRFAEGGIAALTDLPVERMSERNDAMAMMANRGQMYAAGGISSLGSYSDGGRMLKGPGDGMSDSIPASIAGKRPARLATEEFVVPADVVSHLGNGSSNAGAKQLYAMMDRVRSARTGTKKQGRQIRPQKMMPA